MKISKNLIGTISKFFENILCMNGCEINKITVQLPDRQWRLRLIGLTKLCLNGQGHQYHTWSVISFFIIFHYSFHYLTQTLIFTHHLKQMKSLQKFFYPSSFSTYYSLEHCGGRVLWYLHHKGLSKATVIRLSDWILNIQLRLWILSLYFVLDLPPWSPSSVLGLKDISCNSFLKHSNRIFIVPELWPLMEKWQVNLGKFFDLQAMSNITPKTL